MCLCFRCQLVLDMAVLLRLLRTTTKLAVRLELACSENVIWREIIPKNGRWTHKTGGGCPLSEIR